MTTRQKAGVALLITSGGGVIAAVVMIALAADPTWLTGVLAVIGAIAGYFGGKATA